GKLGTPGSPYSCRNSAGNRTSPYATNFRANVVIPVLEGNVMSPIKAMPLLLAAIAPFVMVAGVARAAEAPIILAQASPQDKKDEHKQQHSQPQQQQPQKGQPQAPHGSPPPHPQA